MLLCYCGQPLSSQLPRQLAAGCACLDVKQLLEHPLQALWWFCTSQPAMCALLS